MSVHRPDRLGILVRRLPPQVAIDRRRESREPHSTEDHRLRSAIPGENASRDETCPDRIPDVVLRSELGIARSRDEMRKRISFLGFRAGSIAVALSHKEPREELEERETHAFDATFSPGVQCSDRTETFSLSPHSLAHIRKDDLGLLPSVHSRVLLPLERIFNRERRPHQGEEGTDGETCRRTIANEGSASRVARRPCAKVTSVLTHRTRDRSFCHGALHTILYHPDLLHLRNDVFAFFWRLDPYLTRLWVRRRRLVAWYDEGSEVVHGPSRDVGGKGRGDDSKCISAGGPSRVSPIKYVRLFRGVQVVLLKVTGRGGGGQREIS